MPLLVRVAAVVAVRMLLGVLRVPLKRAGLSRERPLSAPSAGSSRRAFAKAGWTAGGIGREGPGESLSLTVQAARGLRIFGTSEGGHSV